MLCGKDGSFVREACRFSRGQSRSDWHCASTAARVRIKAAQKKRLAGAFDPRLADGRRVSRSKTDV